MPTIGIHIPQGITGFNPRPPLPRGDAVVEAVEGPAPFAVSIHAPRCRVAMPTTRATLGLVWLTVSIHAPRCRGAMPPRALRWATARHGFNPRPPLPRGDAGAAPREARSVARFQSTPPRGDARHNHSLTSIPTIVSIHAPRCRGAMPREPSCRWPACEHSFNPRPPLPRGDAGPWRTHLLPVQRVSIHAPRCRGAMPTGVTAIVLVQSKFQSTPPVAEGRCHKHVVHDLADLTFQSTPPVAEGRCPYHAKRNAIIRAFQSTPPVAEGRCRFFNWLSARYLNLFQSTPPVAEGRCPAPYCA